MRQSGLHAAICIKTVSMSASRVECLIDLCRMTNLDRAGIRFNVDHIADHNLLLQNRLVDGRIQTQLLRPLDGLESDDDMRDSLPISTKRVLCFCRRQFRHFAFVNFLRLLYAQA